MTSSQRAAGMLRRARMDTSRWAFVCHLLSSTFSISIPASEVPEAGLSLSSCNWVLPHVGHTWSRGEVGAESSASSWQLCST